VFRSGSGKSRHPHLERSAAEAYVFGAHVSGSGPEASLQASIQFGAGGAFGPEASVVTVVLGFLLSAALLAVVKRFDLQMRGAG
jgi:hypothetical protein